MARATLTIAGLLRFALTVAIFLPLFLGGAERLGDVGFTLDHVLPHPILLGALTYPAFATAMFLVWLDGRGVHSATQRIVLSLICLFLIAIATLMWSIVIEGAIKVVSDLYPARHRVTLPHWLPYFLMLGSLPFALAVYRAIETLPSPIGRGTARRRQRPEAAG